MEQQVEPRGIRNNNPGNIKWSQHNDWIQQTGKDEDGFCIFSDPVYGIRAIIKILASYQKRNINTVEDIINTWAPPEENNTDSYIEHICQKTHLASDFIITWNDYPALTRAIIHHENGKQPYSDTTIQAAMRLAK